MLSETFLLVLEGVWASITGGWHYDKKQSDFSNLFHLYIWLLFLCLPFLNYLFVNSKTSWTIYVCLITTIFIIIKLINLYLHRLFDTAKCIEEDAIVSETDNALSLKSPTNEEKDVFEMRTINVRTYPEQNLNWSMSQDELEGSKTENSQKIDCHVDVHFNDTAHAIDNQPDKQSKESTSVFDLSALFNEYILLSDENILQKDEIISSLPQNGSLQIVSTSGTSLSNITPTTVNAKPKSTQSVGVIESGDPISSELSTFRRARSELQSKNSSKTIFNPPSHPVSLEIINSKQQPKQESALQTTQLNRARENISQMDSSVPFLEETNQSSKDAKGDNKCEDKCDDKSDDKSEIQPSPGESSQQTSRKNSKQPVFAGVYLNFDSSDDGDESEISLCVRDSTKNKSQLSRKSKTSFTRKVRYSTNNRKRHSKSFTSKKNHSSKISSSSAKPTKFTDSIEFLSDSEFDEELNDTFVCSNTSDSNSSSSIRICPELNPLVPSTSTGFSFGGYPFGKCRERSVRSHDSVWKSVKISSAQMSKYISTLENESEATNLGSNATEQLLSTSRRHVAASHEDTSLGAVHVFQDEKGNWLAYTFDENSTGTARHIVQARSDQQSAKSDVIPSSSVHIDMSPTDPFVAMNDPCTSSCSTRFVKNRPDSPVGLYDLINVPDSLGSGGNKSFNQESGPFLEASTSSEYRFPFNNVFGPSSLIATRERPKKNFYYEMNIFNLKKTKIRFDRLALLAFLDRNINSFELISSIVLAILVSVFASIIISHNFFRDLQLVLFCLVVASSQYTLLKSVQPDAASPTHGFNRITIYGRPIYFCLASFVMLLSNEYVCHYDKNRISFELYGLNLFDRQIIEALFFSSKTFLLAFPFFFVFGFLPQINTFLMFLLEQIDIHFFGGTAATIGLASATYSVLRSFLSVSFLSLCGHILAIDQDHGPKFSVFCGLLVSISYHLSRLPTNPSLYWNFFKSFTLAIKCLTEKFVVIPDNKGRSSRETSRRASFDSRFSFKSHSLYNLTDPLPHKIKQIKNIRFQSDLVTCTFIGIIVFGAHVSSIFKLQPIFNNSLTCLVLVWGFFLHYILIKFRKQLPWLFFSHPILKSNEYQLWDVNSSARIMIFERLQAWLWLLEKNIVLPLFFLGYLTTDCSFFMKQFGSFLGIIFLVLCSVKSFRSGYNDPSSHYMIILFTHLLFLYDFKTFNHGKENIFLINFFFVSIIYQKVYDLLLKLRFVVTYVAPWQITWGSAFHAFAQPFSVPHSAMLLVQILISSVLSSPLQPLMGSAIFLASYVRPIKFWERDYNTKRVDHSNTRLASQIDNANIGSDDNNLNSIFYEHLTRSLQHSLYGDIALGRWSDVSQGDCFVLAGYSDNLNCLIHIIELGNGMVTFQLRGLEFRGTYCQQREVEAITESVSDDEGCCCCEPGHFRGLLSVNAAFNQRWLSWEVTQPNYILEGYSISVNSANTLLQPYDFRKGLITNYVKSIIYFCIGYKKFRSWITNEELCESLAYLDDSFVDLDPTFNHNIDEDFDFLQNGITRKKFRNVYFKWIRYCVERKLPYSDSNFAREHIESVITLCFGLSLLARRAIGVAAQNYSTSLNVEFFLYGLHALFKGDFRVHCFRDEWVFQDMAFLDQVIAPSVRMSLKLHQDQFTLMEEWMDELTLYEAITEISQTIVISHEADPVWRNAILSNVPSLLALRHVLDEGADQYKVIMLNRRFLNFRIIKINRECVRGLWAGQQQELIFLRNSNPERGSIQNAKQALRNIINSSCDQPIGYPIYVSPLTTSFAETSDSLLKVIGPPLTLSIFKRAIINFFEKIRNRCREVCSGTGSGTNDFVLSHRVSKSESSDRGLDDSISFGNKTISSQVSKYPMKNLISSKMMMSSTQTPTGVQQQTTPNVQSTTISEANSSKNAVAAVVIAETST